MKKFYSICLLLVFLATGITAQPQPEPYAYDLSYFLPQGNYTYNKNIPTPESITGFQIGEQHADWGQVVKYMETLASISDRVTIKEMGRTYQHRPFIEVTFTSADNQKKIDRIKEEHLKLSDVNQSGSLSLKDMPVVVSLIYSIHGNEPSGVNASLAIAYFLAAAEGNEINDLLNHTVVVMTPGANPDGINRFASWVNTSRSLTDVSDLNSREFLEPWPSSRTNHYWTDCNRDWLMAQHPEGINGLDTYFDWLPNIVVDQHEQGSARPYYFSPGHPKRTHPFTPQLNQDLTAEISSYCATELDKIGTGYYSKEGYDDYYYGKGAAYGDIHGSVCLLYEQGTSRGHLRMTVNGIRSFAWTVRNQALASYATLIAGYKMKDRLLTYQKEYYEKTGTDAQKETVKGYVFDTRGSKAIRYHFLENMAHHRIDVYHLAKDYSAEGKQFKKEDAYIIPVEQKYSMMVKALMENSLEYIDSTFYDISTWTFPHAFNLKYVPVKTTAGLIGAPATENKFQPGQVIGGKSDYGYVFENKEFYAPKVIYELQKKGLYINVSGRPFTFHSGDRKKTMGYGTVQVMAQNQPVSADEIYNMMVKLSKETGVDIYAATTGLMEDVDLASPAYMPIRQPKVAVLVGRTMGIPDSGEIWYLLDKRFQMCPVLIESNILTAKKLQAYNVIVMANGVPALGKASETALKEWIGNGGTLIATGKAWQWVNDARIMALKTKSTAIKADSAAYLSYESKKTANAGNDIDGVILNCHLDKTHPLAWGLEQNEIAVMKKGNIIFKKDANPYISPLHYTSKPLLSGFLSAKNQKLLKDTPAVFAKPYKSGCIIIFADDMNFRSYWFGTSKLFMNAVFFNECIK
ncbi:M14 family metallopeptidase [Phocaeicola sp.]